MVRHVEKPAILHMDIIGMAFTRNLDLHSVY